jgi:hypothetical protein
MRNTISKIALTATLAFAITLTLSCSSGDDGGNEPSSGSVAAISSSSDGGSYSGSVKSITITGIPSGYSNADIEIAECLSCKEFRNADIISNGKVTINLSKTKEGRIYEYSGSGSFIIFFGLSNSDRVERAFFYTEGKTFDELGIVIPCHSDELNKLPKYNASSENPSISFNLFKELADETGCPDEEDYQQETAQ